MQPVIETNIKEYPLASRGKVRDIYEISPDSLLIVTSDRISAYDVIMPEPIPMKGWILNQTTLFWMKRFTDLVPNHIIASDVKDYPQSLHAYEEQIKGRSVLVKKAKPLPIECIVRGFITGSGWKDYKATGSLCGYDLPANMKESEMFPEPLFTPSTKAEIGDHDENISLKQATDLIGRELMDQVQNVSLEIYGRARDYARERGIIIADTKFEFGLTDDGLILIDEVLTPDSSRFWPMDGYEPGHGQPSFDKQFLRDWLTEIGFNQQPPAPHIPEDIIQRTQARYIEAYERLTGAKVGE